MKRVFENILKQGVVDRIQELGVILCSNVISPEAHAFWPKCKPLLGTYYTGHSYGFGYLIFISTDN